MKALGLLTDELLVGGKAAGLARAIEAGLTVPPGYVFTPDEVEEIRRDPWCRLLKTIPAALYPVAVRSSAIGEDGRQSSFAGMHATALNCPDHTHVFGAVAAVLDSARSEEARAYRARLGLAEPRMAVIVQRQLNPKVSGVMFTRSTGQLSDPIRVVNAVWGLGEPLVSGRVTPDEVRFTGDGTARYGSDESPTPTIGWKDFACLLSPLFGTIDAPLPEALRDGCCLSAQNITDLAILANVAEGRLGPGLDIEWAFTGSPAMRDTLHVLQVRPITAALR